jgi:hypothetical protein
MTGDTIFANVPNKKRGDKLLFEFETNCTVRNFFVANIGMPNLLAFSVRCGVGFRLN